MHVDRTPVAPLAPYSTVYAYLSIAIVVGLLWIAGTVLGTEADWQA